MAILSPFQCLLMLAVVLSTSMWLLVDAGEVVMGGFTKNYGWTGCLSDPTRGCVDNSNGDTCYDDRGLAFAISGTAPLCNACMPKDYRNIAAYEYPINLPCALWRYYQCDDLFVTHVWYKSGNNACSLAGRKSYNMYDTFDGAAGNEQEFIKACRQQGKKRQDYGLPAATPLINEKDFCFPMVNNLTIADPTQKLLPSYKEYYEHKYGTVA